MSVSGVSPRISIVIRCYNEEQHIGKLLTGITQQSCKNVEIIIVDSGSTDATLAIASHYAVKIIQISPADFTFGRALNIGCEAAAGDFIVLASAHVYPLYRDWLELLVRNFLDSRVALVYGRQRGNEQSKYSELRIFEKWFPDTSLNFQSHPFCNNANAAIRRSIWQLLPYDENLTGLEDLEWARKALKAGYRISYCAEAEIVHVHEETPGRVFNRYRREAIAMKAIYPEEQFSFFDFIKLFVTNSISDLYHAFHHRILVRNVFEIIMFRFMQFYGTYRGYDQQGPVSAQLKDRFYYPNRLKRSDATGDSDAESRKIDYSTM